MSTQNTPYTKNTRVSRRYTRRNKAPIFHIDKVPRSYNRRIIIQLSSDYKELLPEKENKVTKFDEDSLSLPESKEGKDEPVTFNCLSEKIEAQISSIEKSDLYQLLSDKQITSFEEENRLISEERMKESIKPVFSGCCERLFNYPVNGIGDENIFSNLVAFNNLFDRLFVPNSAEDQVQLDRIKSLLFVKFCNNLFNSFISAPDYHEEFTFQNPNLFISQNDWQSNLSSTGYEEGASNAASYLPNKLLKRKRKSYHYYEDLSEMSYEEQYPFHFRESKRKKSSFPNNYSRKRRKTSL